MKPVHQTIFDSSKGNCLSAAIASILELSIDDVPNFCKDFGLGYFDEAVQLFLRNRGYAWLRVLMPRVPNDDDSKVSQGRPVETREDLRFHYLPDHILCMATGKSPRGEWHHVVVGEIRDGYNFRMLHDPHPAGTGLEGLPVTIEFLVPMNPANMHRP